MPWFRLGGIAALFLFVPSLMAGAPGRAAERTVDLFRAVDATVASSDAPLRGVERQRLMQLDLRALETAVAPRGRDKAANRVQQAAELRGKVRVEVLPRVTGTFRREAISEAHGGGYVWTGVEEFGRGEATFVVRNDKITGQLQIADRTFRIEPVSEGMHRISEIRIDRLRPDAPHPKPRVTAEDQRSTVGTAEQPTFAESTTPDTIVDVLAPYTMRASRRGDILADINLAVSLVNRAYRNSRVKVRLNLRETMLVAGYDETAYSYSGTLYNLTDMNGADSDALGRRMFDAVRLRRDQVGADLVALFRQGGEFCGQAWVIEKPAPAYSSYGFSQISRDCIAGHTLAHELGHNMGLNHDRYVEPREPVSQYNYGFVRVRQRDRDIMSYPDRCRDVGLKCVLRNRFSNPRQFIDGARFGRFQKTKGAADASRRLNETRAAISEYRDAGALSNGAPMTASAR